ncbi:GTP-binding protein [Desulfatibacillum aliphaticivorans]|uniref:GTP-binding protein n=1 Tax=Desulfatibacillum aliphaticivorans TaxID=218208 RepID=UPI00041F5587|nr:GTPase [Desulfatibacillum aliphaticivorans]
MAQFDENGKKMVVKIVYYGPALSGKTTNLMRLHDAVNPSRRGDLLTLETKGDRTLFFDLLPLAARSKSNFLAKIKLYTVPGQVAHDATRKAVLSRADGVVFVADSQLTQSMSNFESFDNLENNAQRVGLDLDPLPLVIQYNKRDLQDIEPEDEVSARWSPTGLPLVFATALKGRGVVETFQRILSATYQSLDRMHGLEENFDMVEDDFLSLIGGGR